MKEPKNKYNKITLLQSAKSRSKSYYFAIELDDVICWKNYDFLDMEVLEHNFVNEYFFKTRKELEKFKNILILEHVLHLKNNK